VVKIPEYKKNTAEKQLLQLMIMIKIYTEILDILIEQHPEILMKAITQVVEKNPDWFKET